MVPFIGVYDMSKLCKLFVFIALTYSLSAFCGEITKEERIEILKRNVAIADHANILKPHMYPSGDRPFAIFADVWSTLNLPIPSYDFRIVYPIGADSEYEVFPGNSIPDIEATISWIENILRDSGISDNKAEVRVSSYKQVFDEDGGITVKYLAMKGKRYDW